MYKITIKDFDRVNVLENQESPQKSGKLFLDPGSDLSFRNNPEDANLSPNSFNQDPALVMGTIGISPIIAVNLATKSFTTESAAVGNSNVNYINIITNDADDDDDYIEKSIGLLSPDLNKLKFNPYTPTFPLVNEEQLSWDGVKSLKRQSSNKFDAKGGVQVQIPHFISPLDSNSKFQLKTMEGSPVANSLTEPQMSPTRKMSEDFLGQPKKGKSKRQKHELSSSSEEIQSSGDYPKAATMGKANESIVGIEQNEDLKFKSKDKLPERKTRLIVNTVNPNLRQIRPRNNQDTLMVPKANLPAKIIRKQSVGKFETNFNKSLNKSDTKKIMAGDKPIVKGTQPNLLTNTSQELKKKSSSTGIILPKLPKKNSKSRSKTKVNPYSPEWSQSTLKTHFQLDMKIVKKSKVQLSKFMKKRNDAGK